MTRRVTEVTKLFLVETAGLSGHLVAQLSDGRVVRIAPFTAGADFLIYPAQPEEAQPTETRHD